MLTPLYASYLDSKNSTFTESEIQPLIIRVYQIVSSILKVKYQSEKYTTEQIEEEAIEVTALLCMRNERGTPLLIVNMKKDLDTADSELDFEFMLYDKIKRYLELI